MKKRIMKIMALAVCVSLCLGICSFDSLKTTAISGYEKNIADLKKQREENEAAIKDFEDLLEKTKNDIAQAEQYQDTLTKKIQLSEANLATTNSLINEMNVKISDLEADINSLSAQISDTEGEIDKDIEEFKLRLRAMYISGDDSIISVISGSTDFYDMLAKMELATRLVKYDQKMFEELNAKIESYNTNKDELQQIKSDCEADKADLEIIKQEYVSELEELETDYEKTDYIKDMLSDEKSVYENEIAVSTEQLAEYDQKIADFEQKIADELERQRQEELRKKREAEAAGKTYVAQFTYTGEAFLWPVSGFYYISSGYGQRWGSLHGGIDIAGTNIANQPIIAAADGEVIIASQTCTHNYPGYCSCGNTYGNYVLVNHGIDSDGTSYATLYAHMTSVAVSQGQFVKAGDVLGYVGTTGYSTGYHLHFEVRRNGSRVNPMDYFSQTY